MEAAFFRPVAGKEVVDNSSTRDDDSATGLLNSLDVIPHTTGLVVTTRSEIPTHANLDRSP
jgi:hypothetical protein